MEEWFFITPARLGLTGDRAQVPVGWKGICAVVERSLAMGIQMPLPGSFGGEFTKKSNIYFGQIMINITL